MLDVYTMLNAGRDRPGVTHVDSLCISSRRSALSPQFSALLKTTYLYIHRARNCGPWHGPMLEISPESPLRACGPDARVLGTAFGRAAIGDFAILEPATIPSSP